MKRIDALNNVPAPAIKEESKLWLYCGWTKESLSLFDLSYLRNTGWRLFDCTSGEAEGRGIKDFFAADPLNVRILRLAKSQFDSPAEHEAESFEQYKEWNS